MKNIIVTLFIICFAFHMQAQYVRPGSGPASSHKDTNKKPDETFWNHVSIGGGFGLQFGTYTYVGLEPLFNYHFNRTFMLGAGPIYQYVRVNDPYLGNYSASSYGARIAGMAFLPGQLSRIFLMAEYDLINIPEVGYAYNIYGSQYPVEIRANLAIPIIGIGFKEPVNDKLFFTIYAFRDLSNNPNSPYYLPPNAPLPVQISAGFDLGF